MINLKLSIVILSLIYIKNQNLKTNETQTETKNTSTLIENTSNSSNSTIIIITNTEDQFDNKTDLNKTIQLMISNNTKIKNGSITYKELKSAFCLINDHGVVYDLNSLKSKEKDYELKTSNGVVHFNLCQNQISTCINSYNKTNTTNSTGIASFTSINKLEVCEQIAGSNYISSKFIHIEERDSKNETIKSSLKLILPHGEVCKEDKNKFYSTSIELICNKNQDFSILNHSLINHPCQFEIQIETKQACPTYNVNSFFEKFIYNKYLLGSLLIVIGAFFCFVGENFLKITQIIAGAFFTSLVILYFVFTFTDIEFGNWKFWIVVCLTFILGSLVGYFMSKIYWLPGLVFGFLLGVVIGFILINIVLRFNISYPLLAFWTIISISIISCCLLGYYKEEEISIISTSIIGAYTLIRGISVMIGGFPSESQLIEYYNKGLTSEISKLITVCVYIYLLGMIILSILGMYIQFKYFYDGKNKNQKEKLNLVKNEKV